ncbi:ribbon-helix-helix protein, CopG family [Rhodococcus erythropolis]
MTNIPAIDQTKPIRLSVNMNNETADALREIAEHYGVSVTEAVRRAVSVAYFVEHETWEGNTVQIEDPKTGKVRELVMM